jgi:hypothetical protein
MLTGKPEGKRSIARPRHRWQDNIRLYLREIRWKDLDCIHLAQVRDWWWA